MDRLKRSLSKQSTASSIQEEDFAESEVVVDVEAEAGKSPSPAIANTPQLQKLTLFRDSGGLGALIPITTSSSVNNVDDLDPDDDSSSSRSGGDADGKDYALSSSAAAAQVHPDADQMPSVSREELKSTLVSVMKRKDQVQDQLASIKSLLAKEADKCSSLTEEMSELRKKSEEGRQKQEARIKTLTRENELLKHQLKKYVSAVMKLRDGPQAYETLAKLEGKNNKTTNSESEKIEYVDYHFEASEFERKLIQVIENRKWSQNRSQNRLKIVSRSPRCTGSSWSSTSTSRRC